MKTDERLSDIVTDIGIRALVSPVTTVGLSSERERAT